MYNNIRAIILLLQKCTYTKVIGLPFFFFLSTNANSIGCAMRQMSANTLSRSKAAVYCQQWAGGNAIVLRMHTYDGAVSVCNMVGGGCVWGKEEIPRRNPAQRVSIAYNVCRLGILLCVGRYIVRGGGSFLFNKFARNTWKFPHMTCSKRGFLEIYIGGAHQKRGIYRTILQTVIPTSPW